MALGTENVKYFPLEISPFAGFDEQYKKGFSDLHGLFPDGRKILFATRNKIAEPSGWQQVAVIHGTQYVMDAFKKINDTTFNPVPLDTRHVDEMVALAALTKPGPFNSRTIEFGHYYGIFQNQKLAAMTGQRMHISNFTEVSAVCTHPEHLGKGYAGLLLQHQLQLILDSGQQSFLHVRSDNERAISLYLRLGFKENGPMNFYLLKRISR